ncbi:hypothetical protein ABEB36_000150 [Hypothenemus hampei]|uniref:MADF domain-containing protein n=1 Tax=Hypothenemus hampei TaxID=57062 RepID=A0ABD1FAE1_HYPHA
MKFSYDPLSLIELIEQRPCLWDKSADDYKDRVKKGNSWQEIYQFLIEDYDNLEENEKLTAGKAVTEKWRHIRDAFGLSLRKKSGDKRSKEYIIVDDEERQGNEEVRTEETDFDLNSEPTPSRSRKRAHSMNAVDMAILKALETTAQPQTLAEIDEDAGFFASITPSVKKFNEDQKLMFRMKVLALIQEIKSQHPRRIPSGPPSNTPSNTSYS